MREYKIKEKEYFDKHPKLTLSFRILKIGSWPADLAE